MPDPVPAHVQDFLWARACTILEERASTGEWQDPEDPDSWGLERERIAHMLLDGWIRERERARG